MNFVSAMQGLVVILWIIIIGLIVIMAIRASRGVRVGGLVGVLIGLLVVTGVLTVLSVGLVFIEPEERGVVISALSSTGYRQDAAHPRTAPDRPVLRAGGALFNRPPDLYDVGHADRRPGDRVTTRSRRAPPTGRRSRWTPR